MRKTNRLLITFLLFFCSLFIASCTGNNDQVASPTWSHPADLTDYIELSEREFIFSYDLAMGAAGNAIAAWELGESPPYGVFLSEYRNGTWTHETNLGDSISLPDATAHEPRIAMNSKGDAVVAWEQRSEAGSAYLIYMSERNNGIWTHPTSLDDTLSPKWGGGGYDYTNYSVAIADNGDAIVVWTEYNADLVKHVFMSERRDGVWHHPVDSNDHISPSGPWSYAFNIAPQLAMLDNGEAIIVWAQKAGDGGGRDSEIFMSEYRDGEWRHPENTADFISSPRPGETATEYPHVAMADNGDVIVVWEQLNGVYMREHRGGTWSPTQNLTVDSDTLIADIYDRPFGSQVVMAANGGTVITWRQSNEIPDGGDFDSPHRIYMQEYRDGNWIRPTDHTDHISPAGEDISNASKPQVAMSDNGDSVIVWSQEVESSEDTLVYMSEYRDGVWNHPVDSEDHINPIGSGEVIPKMAMGANGNILIFWQELYDNKFFMSEYLP